MDNNESRVIMILLLVLSALLLFNMMIEWSTHHTDVGFPYTAAAEAALQACFDKGYIGRMTVRYVVVQGHPGTPVGYRVSCDN